MAPSLAGRSHLAVPISAPGAIAREPVLLRFLSYGKPLLLIGDVRCFGLAAQSSRLQDPVLVEQYPPVYTDEARTARLEGRVLLSVLVGKDGRPMDVTVREPLGLGLDDNAVAAVRQWRFAPGLIDGQRLASRTEVTVGFPLTADAGALHLTHASFDVPEGATRPVLLAARYTPGARGAAEKGAFSVSFQVNEQGVPVNIQVGSASDPSNVDEVIAMVREWRFQAASRNGTLVTAQGYLDFAWGDAALATTLESEDPLPADGRPRLVRKKP